MRKWEYYWYVYLLLENSKWEMLYLFRKNTWYMASKYWLPSWHLEWDKTLKQWIIRESKEEVWIDLRDEDLQLLHVCHRITKWHRVYFDFYFKASKYYWKISNNEPEKSSGVFFIEENHENIISFVRETIKKIRNWDFFFTNN